MKKHKEVKTSAQYEREKLDERREQVLAKGRKFKYPLQYAKHRLVINTIIISVVVLILAVAAGWFALYKTQDTGDIIYRITQVLPVPVARVEDENVRYSDYLMIYRSSMTTVQQQSGQLGDDADAETVKTEYKRSALNNAEDYTYALKTARELNINVSSEEVDAAFENHRKVGGTERSEESFLKILQDNFGLTKSEYQRMLYLSLIKSKVMEKIDNNAQSTAKKIETLLAENGGDLRNVAETLGEAVQYEETGGLVDAMNIDGGRATAAKNLQDNEISPRFISNNGDGYYFVKLISKTDTQVNYASLKVPFTEFSEKMKSLRSSDKIKEFIELEKKPEQKTD